ncbi:MAG: DUF1801 domain-containing protein [Polyangiales bacterium]
MPKAPATVDALLIALQHPFHDAILALRAALLAADGTITERVKWNAPSFCIDGDDRATLRFPPKGGLQLILHRGAKVKPTAGFHFDDPTGRVTWAAPDRGVLIFDTPDDLHARCDEVVALVNAWMRATRETSPDRGG